MKKIILGLMVIVFASAAYACDLTATLNKDQSKSYTANGNEYNVTFHSLVNNSGDLAVKFKVNGEITNELEKGQKYSFGDLSDITLDEITLATSSTNTSARFCLRSGLSCTDCGLCSSSKQCDDSNACTIDECDGDPLRCKHKLILWCKNDDGCCPKKCSEKNDNDCKINQTTMNSTNSSLINLSLGNISVIPCISNDSICQSNCTYPADTDCSQCDQDQTCDDNKPCTIDVCSGSPKRCSNTAKPGCEKDGKCLSIGVKDNGSYCSQQGSIQSLKKFKDSCSNYYECEDRICRKGVCKKPPILKRVTGWFTSLF